MCLDPIPAPLHFSVVQVQPLLVSRAQEPVPLLCLCPAIFSQQLFVKLLARLTTPQAEEVVRSSTGPVYPYTCGRCLLSRYSSIPRMIKWYVLWIPLTLALFLPRREIHGPIPLQRHYEPMLDARASLWPSWVLSEAGAVNTTLCLRRGGHMDTQWFSRPLYLRFRPSFPPVLPREHSSVKPPPISAAGRLVYAYRSCTWVGLESPRDRRRTPPSTLGAGDVVRFPRPIHAVCVSTHDGRPMGS